MFKRAFFPAVLFAFAAGVFVWTTQSPFWQSLRQVSGIMRLVHAEYVDAGSVGYEALAEAAIRGMVESLDPYSRYIPASDFARFEQSTRLQYVGIGVEIERYDQRVTVVTAFPEGPAAQAGLRAGDQIVGIDGREMDEASVVEVSEALRGPAGGEAVVEVFRPSSEEQLTFSLIRRPIDLASVVGVELDEEGWGYLRITQFGERTPAEFRSALDSLEERNMRGLVIDLRNNPGGLLRTSKDVAAEFFKRGELITFMQGRDPSVRTEFRSETPTRPVEYPIAVLINERSASGSEIVAGALQDAGKAWVIGEKSYGKGSVQSVYAFRDGGGMRQTTALYYLPSGRSIHESGVIPDEEVPMSQEEERRLRLQMRHQGYLSATEFEQAFQAAPDQVDHQRAAAIDYLRRAVAEHGPERI